MDRIPLIRANNYEPVIETLKTIGAPAERLASKINFPTHILETSPESFVAEYPLWLLLENASRSQGIEHFGYIVAMSSSVNDLGAFGKQLCDNSTNLYTLLSYFFHTIKQHSTDCHYWLEAGENEILFCRLGTPCLSTGRWQAEQYVVVILIQLVRLVAGTDWFPDKILFETTNLQGIKQCDLFANSHIYYGQNKTAISISNNLLNQSSPGQTPLEQFNSLQPEYIPDNLSERLKTVLFHLVHEDKFAIETACAVTGTKPRTLQRWLSLEGVSFSKVITQIRYEKASQLLQDQEINIIDISYELGYSDPAHFSRAFRRWSGVSPTSYRAQMLTGL